MASAVRECLKLVKVPSAGDIQEVTGKKAFVERTLRVATEKRKNLLGFEKSASALLAKKITELQKEHARLKKLLKYGSLPSLDFAALKWRDQQGMPQLVLFALNSPVCEFTVTRRRVYAERYNIWDRPIRRPTSKFTYRSSMKPKVPQMIRTCYADVFDRMTKTVKKQNKTMQMVAEVAGILPEGVRGKIREVQKTFRIVFIITEPNGWNRGEARLGSGRQIARDAILAGFDGEGLWVIDSFTLMPVDQFLSDARDG